MGEHIPSWRLWRKENYTLRKDFFTENCGSGLIAVKLNANDNIPARGLNEID
jgi:hypothetical protein